MTLQNPLPGSWSDWMSTLGEAHNPKTHGSSAILRRAKVFAETCGVSVETATAQLLWLGSTAMLNNVRIEWPSGVWQPSGLQIGAIEEDGVPIDIITNSVIDVAYRLGLDPIQDTVKEGPAGLIARLERKPARWVEQIDNLMAQGLDTIVNGEKATIADNEELDVNGVMNGRKLNTLEQLSRMDTSGMGETQIANVGNVRGLIYPSGRAFMSYLFDTAFFNTLDELVQHGNLHVRGKQEQHRLRQMNLSIFTAFYQGALANLLTDSKVQSNLGMLLRQMVVLWSTDGIEREPAKGRISAAMRDVEEVAGQGLEYLSNLGAPTINMPYMSRTKSASYTADDVGIRFVSVNRYERMMRIALSVAFWRIADGDMDISVTEGDCAVADAILHCHDMGARLLEFAVTRGKVGVDAMRIFARLLDGESMAGESVQFASSAKSGELAIDTLGALSILNKDGLLAEEYRFVSASTQRQHAKRWGLYRESTPEATHHTPCTATAPEHSLES